MNQILLRCGTLTQYELDAALALQAQQDWKGAEALWLQLLPLAKLPLQRDQLELALAMNYERSGQLAKVFASALRGGASPDLTLVDHQVHSLGEAWRLQQLGVSHAVAGDGREGLELLAASAFDMVISDCRMPVMDGIEATRRIRALPTAKADVPIDELLSADFARGLAEKIDLTRAMTELPDFEMPLHRDTVYISIVDDERNAVSFINSIFDSFGTGLVAPNSGVILHNRGQSFSLKRGHPNMIAPEKRPLHTIIPAFITKDGRPVATFGLMGGAMQPQGHAQIVMNLVDFGMNLQEAGDAPRIQHDGSTDPAGRMLEMTDGGVVNLETGFPYETIRALMRKGHRIEFADGPYGGYQAIMRDHANGVYVGASESRKDGQAAGY